MKNDSNDTPQLLIENQICFPLYSAANAIVRAYRPFLDKIDMTYLQYIVMMVLWEELSLNVKELGQRLRLDSGTLTPLLKRLESKGFVERKRSEHDERVRIISLTAAGIALKEQAKHIPEKLSCAVDLPATQLRELKDLCEQFLGSLDH